MTQHDEECKFATTSISAAAAIYPVTQRLDLGDHEEIATRTKSALQSVHGRMVYAEGEFYRFDKVWKPLPEAVVERVVARHSGIMNGDREPLKITAPTVASVTKLVRNKMSDEAFFEATPRQGIATMSGLIVFDAGAPTVIPHAREHRRRFVIAADWPVSVSSPGLFARALQTAFKGDSEADDKVIVLQELFGALALGLSPWELEQPKAGVLYGPQNGGKSTLLELAAVLIPPEAVCSLNPAVFANRIECTYSLPVLAGKQLNISGELGPGVVLGEKWKEVITGDRQSARTPGKATVLFRPRALHLYACNHLPGFARGLEGAMQRRVAPIPCDRIIPENERIVDLVRRVREEDMAGLLAFAAEGAQRLLARERRYSEPPFIRRVLDAWGSAGDPVMAWAEDCVELLDGGRMKVNEAYKSFEKHAKDAGVREIPTRSDFKDRVASAGLRPLPKKIAGYYWLDGGRLIGAAKASGATKS